MFGRQIAHKRPIPSDEKRAFREVSAFFVLAGAFCLFVAADLFAMGAHIFRIT